MAGHTEEPPQSDTRGITRLIERRLGDAAVWSFRRHKAVLIIAVLLTAMSVWTARSLRMDTDLTHLLPKSFASVQSLAELEDKSWGVGYVSVAVSGGDRAARRRVAEALVPPLEALETIQYVDFRKPAAFFADRAPYYLERADLETIRDRIDERHLWEVRSRSPMHDLELEPLGDPPSLDFSDLRDKYEPALQRAGIGPERTEQSAYLEDEELLVLLARPSRRSSDVGFNDRVVDDVEALIAETDLSAYGSGLKIATSGRYKKKAEQKAQIEADLRLASLLALALIIAYLAFHFRRVGAVGLVLLPLVMGLSWTFGATTLAFGSLNLLTGFIGALLLGVGVDHGIHLLARIDAERASGNDVETDVCRAFGSTGRAVVAAALTTVFAFAGVAVSEFRAFREFGMIAAGGLSLTVLAYATVLPALLGLLARARRRGHAPAPSAFAQALPRWAPAVWWLAALGAVAGMWSLPDARFDYDFASLESADLPAFRLDRRINQMLGRSQTPLLALADDVEHERAITRALRERSDELGNASAIQLVMSLDDLVPQHAADKAEVVGDIHTLLRDAKESWLSEEQNKQRKRLIEMTSSKPFGRAELPEEVTRQFLGRDGATSFVLIYPSVSLSDGAGVRRLATELRGARLPDGRELTVAGEAMVLADVLDMVVAETPVVLAATLVLVLLVLLVLLGPKLIGPCLFAALTTLLVTTGLMAPLELSFNYLNIIVVPVLFGMAVDGAVHVVVRYESERDVAATVSETGRAVAGAILTTTLGFGAFTIAHHPGLASLGRVAVLGLAVNLLVCLVLLPAGLALLERTRRPRAGGGWLRFLVTIGFAGDSPVAPGTMGALVAVPLGIVAQRFAAPARAAIIAVGIVGSVVVVARYLRRTNTKDPSEVVIDELVGCLIAMLLVPHGLPWALAAFVLFRLLDIFKPWPISYIDRRIRGAWGVMGDDIVAGMVAGATLLSMHHWGLSRGWWS